MAGKVADTNYMTKNIEYDNSSSAQATNTNLLSWTHTIGTGNNRMLIVGIVLKDNSTSRMNVKTVKFGNEDMMYLSDSSVIAGTSGEFLKTMLYFLPNPSCGISETSISTVGKCCGISAGGTSLKNVYQGIPEAVATNGIDDATATELTTYINTFSENAWVIDVACSSARMANLSTLDTKREERWKEVSTEIHSNTSSTKMVSQIGRNSVSYSSSVPGRMALSCAAFAPVNNNLQVTIAYDLNSTEQNFAVNRLERTLLQLAMNPIKMDISKSEGKECIIIRVEEDPNIKKEGFRILKEGESYIIKAVDQSGAMYGILEISEKILINGLSSITEEHVDARFPFRAIKHNTPWSSYRIDLVFDQHYDTMKDIAYWESFINMMAENRYNTLTIWTQHPFPYLIRPINFPKATPFSDDELTEWKYLYTNIFRMCKERGIEVYIINWNIFVSEGFRKNYDMNARTDAMGFFGDGYTTPQIEKYTRECVTQMLNEYPDLTGFGFTQGEFMGGMTPEQREEWTLNTIVEGAKAANRPVKLIYRLPLSAGKGSGGSMSKDIEVLTRNSIESIEGVVSPIETETKFNWSHAYSSTKLIQVHGGGISSTLWEPNPTKYRMNWMIRNEDFFTLRWGQPDFIREHIKNNGQSYVGGYYIGSECCYPAFNYFDIQKEYKNRINYAFQRQWLLYMTWGRLIYSDNTPDESFELAFDQRYGKGIGRNLLNAYKRASEFPKLFGSYIFSTWDFTSYAEGFISQLVGEGYDDGHSPFLSLVELMDHKVLNSDYLSIKDYVRYIADIESIPLDKITPLQLADTLERNASEALNYIKDISSINPALEEEIGDVKAWSYLSYYFGDKLRAGVALENYSVTKNIGEKNKAIYYINLAKTHWENLVQVTKQRYKPTRLIHIGEDFSWQDYLIEIQRDIYVAENYI